MRTLISIFILFFSLIFIGIMCSNQPVQHSDGGGGTETVIGTVINKDGSNASGTEVIIIPEDYNPVEDKEIPDSMITTTNSGGRYIFSSISPGTYNIQAVHPVSKMQLFRSHITVTEEDTVILEDDTLKEPGAVKVVMPDTVDIKNGFIFIRGTNIYRELEKGNQEDVGLYSLILDSIPAARFTKLQYIVKDENINPVQLKDAFTIASRDTILIEAYDYSVVVGSVVYKDNIFASGITVYIIPENYIPLKDRDLPKTMSDTTDINGVFIFKLTARGNYNIQAIHPGQSLQLFQPHVVVDRDTVNLSALTLKEPGTVKLILPDTMNMINGYVYIEGTNIYGKLSDGNWLDTGFYLLYLTSLPIGSYAAIHYSLLESSVNPIQLTDSFTVSSQDALMVEAFINWKYYNQSNSGLPSDKVLDMFIAQNGTKWFGTDAGVVSYDGTDWIVYNRNNSGLLSDTVMSVTINTDGAKWFGTSYGVAKYDGIEWETFTTEDSDLPNDSVFEVVADGYGNVWIGTDYGAAKYDDNGTWEVYTPDNSPLPDIKGGEEIYNIAIDHDDVVWLGTDGGGLVRLDGNNWTIYNKSNSSLPSKAIFSIYVDDENNKWIGTFGGVSFYDGATWEFYNVGIHTYEYTVSAIAVDNDDIKWFGTYEGGRLFRFDGERMICYNAVTSIISPDAYEMFAIKIDENNNKWVTTTRGGIYVFGPIKGDNKLRK